MVIKKDISQKKYVVSYLKQINSYIETGRSDNTITVKVDYIAIRPESPTVKGWRRFFTTYPTFNKEIARDMIECIIRRNKTWYIIAEVIPHPGFSYYYELDRLEDIVKTSHRLSIKTTHSTRKFSANEPIYQYLFDVEESSQLLYLLKSFDHGAQLILFVVDTQQNMAKVAELLKQKFELSYWGAHPSANDLLSEIFKICEYVISFNFDGDMLTIETMRESMMEEVKKCLQSIAEKEGIEMEQTAPNTSLQGI